MSPPQLRKEIKKAIDDVPVERLESLADYVHFLSRPPLLVEIERSKAEAAAGRGVPWRTVRKDV